MDSNTAFVVATVVLGILLPFVQEPLNKLFAVSGPKAFLVAAALSAVASVIALFATGQVSLTEFSLENFSSAFTIVMTLSQAVFQFLKDKLGWTAG